MEFKTFFVPAFHAYEDLLLQQKVGGLCFGIVLKICDKTKAEVSQDM